MTQVEPNTTIVEQVKHPLLGRLTNLGCERIAKVFEKIKELVKPRSNVTPLNVAGKRYARIFDSAPPQHLGIALLVLLPEGIGPERSYHIVPYLKAAFQTMKALMEVKSIAAELKPNGVSKIHSQCIGVEIPHGFLGESVTAAFPDEIIGLPTAVFFDADRKIDMNRLTGLAMAVRVIERLALDTDSYEPADHRKVSMLAADATQYRKSVEDIYDKGIGVWSRELLPYYHAWRNGLHAHLEMRPVVTAMLSSLAATPTPTELHFTVPDEYALLAKQK